MSPWLSKDEFTEIFSKVPRLTVEIIAISADGGVLLTKREIEPCKGSWHVPGGTVYFGETVEEAVIRITQNELGVAVEVGEFIGRIEYPSHYQNGLDSPVGLAFKVNLPKNFAIKSDASWFHEIPKDMHPDQDTFLIKNNLLTWGPGSSLFSHTG